MKQRQPTGNFTQTPWLILFDGVCGWCTGWVRFLIKYDSDKRFQFAPLQSPLGQQLLKNNDLAQAEFSSFVVITSDGYLTKSTAALHLLHRLGGTWRIMYIFILIPKFLRDWGYDIMARYRYQLRGTLTKCYRPPQEYEDRFLYDI